ncbi:MAG: VOC family protein [Anaerolineae bacterium]|nr:VOC family protein [Anaerolineae bacterium]
MTLTIDHVVIAVRDLERAVTDYRTAGFIVIPGGQHADGLTHNALIVFQDGTYLELLAPTPQAQITASRSGQGFLPLLRQGEGLATFALQSDDLAADRAALLERGMMAGITPVAGRVRPDGVELRWQTAWLTDGWQPFFIQDITTRSLRVPDEAEVCAHPNTALGTARLKLAVRNLAAAMEKYGQISGQEAIDGTRFEVGGIEIELVEETGLLPQERLSEVVLKGRSNIRLPMGLTHQAAIQMQATP